MIKIKKYRIISALALILCTLLLLTAFDSPDVKVYVNGMRLNEPAYIKDGSTYIPLRAVSESMGAEVQWDAKTRSAYVSFTEDDAIAQIVSDISPSVVTIIGNHKSEGDTYKYNNPTAHGSGVIYKSNGHILTNAHVVKDIKNLTVVLNDGQSFSGKVLYMDEDADLAVVKIEKLGLKPITFADESTILSGKTAIAIGTPISLSMRNSVTKGIVSGYDVALSGSHFKLIQTDAAINPGNSGGPLVNAKGELIGINSSKFMRVGIDNMGFAIPIDTVEYALSQFEKNGKIIYPKFGFDLEESWEAKIGLPTNKGVSVKNSNIENIPDDSVITKLNGIDVHSIADWNEAIKDTFDGKSINVEYTVSGKTETAEINML